jgi:hypothetical protein
MKLVLKGVQTAEVRLVAMNCASAFGVDLPS